jgi:hypothetical protein
LNGFAGFLQQRPWPVFIVAIASLVAGTGMRNGLFALAPDVKHPPATPSISTDPEIPGEPAQLEYLDAGLRLVGLAPPGGWSHVVLRTIPELTSGDLETLAANSLETARRIRPVILADIQRAGGGSKPYRLARVGVGLCSPASEDQAEVTVTSSNVEGSHGKWSAKERIILTAMAYETSKARLASASSTFAIVRTPVTYLRGGSHQSIALFYVLLLDPRTGELETFVWPEAEPSKPEFVARKIADRSFTSPTDVHARKVFGSLPVSWTFAVKEMPAGADVTLPASLSDLISAAMDDPERLAEAEKSFRAALAGR